MTDDLYRRIFKSLEDLIPGLAGISSPGTVFYAPVRTQAGLALLCSVCSSDGTMLVLEIAKDSPHDGDDRLEQCMRFSVNQANGTARLIAYEAGMHYENIDRETGCAKTRRSCLNVFANNWLSLLINLQLAFTVVSATSNHY